MERDNTLYCLSLINYALGISIGVVSLIEFNKHRNITPLLIVLAVIIAGPLEDALVRAIEDSNSIPAFDKNRHIQLVDQLTSLGFLFFLLLAALNSK